MNTTAAHRALTRYLTNRTRIHTTLNNQMRTGVKATNPNAEGPPAGTDTPDISDPTGETAITPDRARTHQHQLHQAEHTILTALPLPTIHHAIGILPHVHLDPPARKLIDHAAQTIHRITTETLAPPPKATHHITNQADPGCQSCARIRPHGQPWWNPPCTTKPTTVASNLETPQLLCRACYDHVRATGQLPNRNALTHKHNTGRWPNTKT